MTTCKEPILKNISGYKGVSWYIPTQQWRARVTLHGEGKFLGYFDSVEAAYQACQMIRQSARNTKAKSKPPTRLRGGVPPAKTTNPGWVAQRAKTLLAVTGYLRQPGVPDSPWGEAEADMWHSLHSVDYEILAALHHQSPLCTADALSAPTAGHSLAVLDVLWDIEERRRDADSTGELWMAWGVKIKWARDSWYSRRFRDNNVEEAWPMRSEREAFEWLDTATSASRHQVYGGNFKVLIEPSLYGQPDTQENRDRAKATFWRWAQDDMYESKTSWGRSGEGGPWRLASAFSLVQPPEN